MFVQFGWFGSVSVLFSCFTVLFSFQFCFVSVLFSCVTVLFSCVTVLSSVDRRLKQHAVPSALNVCLGKFR
jgi:hypothetical protein